MKKGFFRKGIVFVIIVLFIGAVVIPSTVGIIEKKTIISNSSSRGYIQDLIDNASEGDTIYVPSGIYYENIIIDKSISLIGEDKDTTIIDGGGIGDVIYISADWVNISSFTMRNSGDDWPSVGIKVDSSNNIIFNCNVSNHNWSGIFLECSSNNIIDKNIVNSNREDGIILLNSSNYNIIVNNTAISNGGGGIRLGDGGDPTKNVTGNLVIRNNASYNVDDGIGLEWSVNNTVMDNILLGNDGKSWSEGISLYHSSNSIVINNTAKYNKRSGIGLQDAHGNKISYNKVVLNNGNGINLLSSSSNNMLTNNKVCNNYGNGISLRGASIRNTFENNIINSNRINGFALSSSSNNTIYKNNITRNIFGIFFTNSYCNKIISNNFIKNIIKAFFIFGHNTWNENYWNRPRILPKPIFGIIIKGFLPIPWLNFDKNPAFRPYKI